MSISNSTVNPPLLPLGIRPKPHSRSPSRSPVHQPIRDLDPVLRSLSPTTTLRAFSADEDGTLDGTHDKLRQSLNSVTSSERSLGVKAARSCLSIRSWARELEGWEWPGTFDVPEPARKKMRMSSMSLASVVSSRTATSILEDKDDEFWGSLPAMTVKVYDQRADEIAQQLDEIDVEELKAYVLSAHHTSATGSSSIDSNFGATSQDPDLRRLDDYTALVTATILQALPYLSRLHRLLDVWTIRLTILRRTPEYLNDLKRARRDLDHGWAAIAVSPATGQGLNSASISRETMAEMKNVIEMQVVSLGRRLDRFLDDLAGREETVPDVWIEDFETLESAYGDWIVQAERKVLENEWRFTKEAQEQAVAQTSAEQNSSNGATSSHQRTTSESYALENPARDRDFVVAPSASADGHVDEVSREPNVVPHRLGRPEVLRDDSQTLTNEPYVQVQSQPAHMFNDTTDPRVNGRSADHWPIVSDRGEGPSLSEASGEPVHGPSDAVNGQVTAPPHDLTALPPVDVAGQGDDTDGKLDLRKRTAFLSREIERASSLQKQVKSPVRPFEHASNAFTRLFKKDRPIDQNRNGSQQSVASVKSSNSQRSSSTKSEKAENERVIWGGRKLLGSSPSASANRESHTDISARPSMPSRSRAGSSKSLTGTQGRGSAVRDYADLPGGFRTRSHSELSIQPVQSLSRTRSNTPREHILQTRAVETYQPKRLSSPIRAPSDEPEEHDEKYPADWPLASPPSTEPASPVKDPGECTKAENAQDSSPEITSPRNPIDSDVFDRMFVQSLPNTPDAQESRHVEKKRSGKPRTNGPGEPTLDSFMLGPVTTPSDLPLPSVSSYARSEYFNLPKRSPSLTELHASKAPTPGSINSDMTPGVVQDASEVGYFHVDPSPDPGTLSPGSMNQHLATTKPRSPLSPRLLKLTIPSPETESSASLADAENENEKPPLIKRASVASVASHSRREVKSIEIPRRSSVSSVSSVPHTPRDRNSAPVSALEPSTSRTIPPSPMSYQGMLLFPSPPGRRNSASASPVSPVALEPTSTHRRHGSALPLSTRANESNDSPAPTRVNADTAPLNAAMTKRRDKTLSGNPIKGQSPQARKEADPLRPGEDTFDRHVSEVLERLPSAHIKFRNRPGAETPTARTSEPRNYVGPRPKTTRVVSKSGAADLTLAPAESTPKKVADNEVKLYHLTQAGKEEPIKLFVRLVGEGERVMVRVGGGWADLADYLHQYATHHGSRTVSGGGIQLQTAKDTPMSRRVSGPQDSRAKRPGTPSSAAPEHSDKGTDDNPIAVDALDVSTSDIPSWNADKLVPTSASAQTPTSKIPMQRSTPKSASSKGSRPSTADSNSRPGSRQGWSDAGLAGPASGKRGDLTQHKAKWVEGMIEKAKAASAEKSKEDRAKYFGELGKAGSTRRVVFRSTSAASGAVGEVAKPDVSGS